MTNCLDLQKIAYLTLCFQLLYTNNGFFFFTVRLSRVCLSNCWIDQHDHVHISYFYYHMKAFKPHHENQKRCNEILDILKIQEKSQGQLQAKKLTTFCANNWNFLHRWNRLHLEALWPNHGYTFPIIAGQHIRACNKRKAWGEWKQYWPNCHFHGPPAVFPFHPAAVWGDSFLAHFWLLPFHLGISPRTGS